MTAAHLLRLRLGGGPSHLIHSEETDQRGCGDLSEAVEVSTEREVHDLGAVCEIRREMRFH